MKLFLINAFFLMMLTIKCGDVFILYSQKIEALDSKNKRLLSKSKHSLFFESRSAAYINVPFLKRLSDTTFIMETYDFETGEVFSEIWSGTDDVRYQYRRQVDKKGFITLNKSPFTKTQKSLVTKWDTAKIRQEEAKKENISSGNLIKAYRCFLKRKQIIVEEFYFRDFFNPKVDVD